MWLNVKLTLISKRSRKLCFWISGSLRLRNEQRWKHVKNLFHCQLSCDVFSTIFWKIFFWARGLLNCQRPAVAFGNDKSSFRQLPLVELTWRYNYSTLLVECILIKFIDLLDQKELLSSRFFQLEKWSPNWLKIESFSHKHSVLPVWNQRQIMG